MLTDGGICSVEQFGEQSQRLPFLGDGHLLVWQKGKHVVVAPQGRARRARQGHNALQLLLTITRVPNPGTRHA
jgi:hypothetical protein